MNDRFIEEFAEERRRAIRSEMDQISLEKLAGQAHSSHLKSSQPLLFKLGSSLVALGRRLRKRHAPRQRDYWAMQNEMRAEHR